MTVEVKAFPRDRVYISGLEVEAIICSITVMESGMCKYDVRYWMNGDQKFASVADTEFRIVK
jgi:hypothetical protein